MHVARDAPAFVTCAAFMRVAGAVRLVVYNPRGQEVARLAEGQFEAGTHAVTWDASDQPSGLYIYRLVGPGIDEKRMMTLVK